MAQTPRASGILMPVPALPGGYGIGDLGFPMGTAFDDLREGEQTPTAWAYRFVDYLAAAGQTYWQVLPLGPTGYGNSPYQCLSAFAGNPDLISLDWLRAHGLLKGRDLRDMPSFTSGQIDYDAMREYKNDRLTLAYDNFRAPIEGNPQVDALQQEFDAWCAANHRETGDGVHAFWLDDFALYATLKERFGQGRRWVDWPHPVLMRLGADPSARPGDTADYVKIRDHYENRQYKQQIEEQKFRQWVFFRQWEALKHYANSKGIRIIGDLPIYVAHDSSDVWMHPNLFDLNRYDRKRAEHTHNAPAYEQDLQPGEGEPSHVAGVPPDYFSVTGQLWGNPLYEWCARDEDPDSNEDAWELNEALMPWWTQRMCAALNIFDIVRIDHFRAFYDYYQIPASHQTAQKGRWRKGPGKRFFDELARQCMALAPELAGVGDPADVPDVDGLDYWYQTALRDKIIAEDLGALDDNVFALRDDLSLPGMAIMQFAFGGSEAEVRFLPEYHAENLVVYTGTHDNNTTVGWWEDEAPEHHRDFMRRKLGLEKVRQPHWTLIEVGMASVARTLIVPMQDLLGLGAEARLNAPGQYSDDNWTWRCPEDALFDAERTRLPELTEQYDRWRE